MRLLVVSIMSLHYKVDKYASCHVMSFFLINFMRKKDIKRWIHFVQGHFSFFLNKKLQIAKYWKDQEIYFECKQEWGKVLE